MRLLRMTERAVRHPPRTWEELLVTLVTDGPRPDHTSDPQGDYALFVVPLRVALGRIDVPPASFHSSGRFLALVDRHACLPFLPSPAPASPAKTGDDVPPLLYLSLARFALTSSAGCFSVRGIAKGRAWTS